MRKIRGSAVRLSLDGVMQAPGGPTEDPTGGFAHGGWLPQFFDEDVGEAIDAVFGKPYDLLLGPAHLRHLRGLLALCRAARRQASARCSTRPGKDEGEAAAIQMGEDFTARDQISS